MADGDQDRPAWVNLLREFEDTLWTQLTQAITERDHERVRTTSEKLALVERELKVATSDAGTDDIWCVRSLIVISREPEVRLTLPGLLLSRPPLSGRLSYRTGLMDRLSCRRRPPCAIAQVRMIPS